MEITISDAAQSQVKKTIVLVGFHDAMAMAAVQLRLASRKVAHLKIWWDDWVIMLATVHSFPVSGSKIERREPFLRANKYRLFSPCISSAWIKVFSFSFESILWTARATQAAGRSGNGNYTKRSQDSMTEALHWLYGTEITYSCAVTCIKASILCLYLRLFGINRVFSKVVYGFMTLVVVWGISLLVSGLFSCTPVGLGFFNSHCIDMTGWFIGTTVPNFIIDGGILVLPLPVIWRLRLSKPRRVGLAGVFLLGILTPIASILRIYSKSVVFPSDVEWDFVTPFVIWSTVEIFVGVICACLLVMSPLLRMLPCQGSRGSRGIAMQSFQHGGNKNRSRRPFCRHDNFSRLEQDSGDTFPELPRKVQPCLRRDKDMGDDEKSGFSRLESPL